MGIKKSIVLSDNTVNFVIERQRFGMAEEVAWSAGVNGAIASLQSILLQNIPKLSLRAWELVLNAYNGHMPTPGMMDSRLASAVMDDLGVISVDDLEPGVGDAIRQLHALPDIEAMAAYDLAVRYWARDWNKETVHSLEDQINILSGSARR